jgi:tRNA-splicing ligase RtcB (3'-phosphate/5'-hydroxy nucleic acid ligase)
MKENEDAVVRIWHDGPLPQGVEAAARRLAASDGVRRVALMPDAHLADDVCIGTVVGTEGTLYPNAVGGDIGCGMAALAFQADAARLAAPADAGRVLARLYEAVPLIRHRRGTAPSLPAALHQRRLSSPALERVRRREAESQLGTLGSGNHFLELQEADDGRLWLMLHSGSRGLGPAVRDHHLERCRSSRLGLQFLESDSTAGREYLDDVQWALDYADANRRAMVEAAVICLRDVLAVEPDEASYFACAHNHVRRETHAGAALWVHRKGAIPAARDERGVVPGSMGTASVHVRGLGHSEALGSGAHGAGRRLSRTEARRTVGVAELSRQLRGVYFDHRLARALREEAPAAYKDLDAVLRAQRDLVRVERRLRPVLVYKGV